jgi:hypothetical protein
LIIRRVMANVPLGEVRLLPKVASELELVEATSGLSRPDVVNRAITLYAAITHVVDMGRGAYRVTMAHSDGSLVDITIRRTPWWRRSLFQKTTN